MKNTKNVPRGTARWIGAALMLLPFATPAQTITDTRLFAPPAVQNNAMPWGIASSMSGVVSGTCSGTSVDSGFATLGNTPPIIAGYVTRGGVFSVTLQNAAVTTGCDRATGRFAYATDLVLDWLVIPSDWQVFQSTVYVSQGGGPSVTAKSPAVPIRLDTEFSVPYGISGIRGALAANGTGYRSCDGRVLDVTDRETMGVPPPPANFRTPIEMIRLTTSRCDPRDFLPALLNLQVPTRYDGVLVYDGSPGAWHKREIYCSMSGYSPGCNDGQYVKFERQANIPLRLPAAGGLSVIAFWSTQADVRGFDLQDMWWAGPGEAGWGLNIAKSGDNLFVAGFIYDSAGKPMWVYMPSGQWDPDTLVWHGDLYSPSAVRYGAYNPLLFRLGAPVGTGSLSFTDADNGHFDYTINGGSGGKVISRYVFAPRGDKPGQYTGIWWGGLDQSGWGLSVSHQASTVFATWYTYGDDGNTTWFFMPAGRQTAPGVFAGDLYSATGDAWAGLHYSSTSTKVTRVGTMELRFGSDKPGTMTAVVNGGTITLPLLKFDF